MGEGDQVRQHQAGVRQGVYLCSSAAMRSSRAARQVGCRRRRVLIAMTVHLSIR